MSDKLTSGMGMSGKHLFERRILAGKEANRLPHVKQRFEFMI